MGFIRYIIENNGVNNEVNDTHSKFRLTNLNRTAFNLIEVISLSNLMEISLLDSDIVSF